MAARDPQEGIPTVPDHHLVEVIGSGAYGDVWLGRTVLGTERAIKVILRSSFESDQPFLREFEGIRRYEPVSRRCPSLVPILQVGRDEGAGCFYSVMELADPVPGPVPAGGPRYRARTLRTDLTQRGRLPVAECVEVGLAMADALETLHGAGLVHRDIKPSNVLLDHDGLGACPSHRHLVVYSRFSHILFLSKTQRFWLRAADTGCCGGGGRLQRGR